MRLAMPGRGVELLVLSSFSSRRHGVILLWLQPACADVDAFRLLFLFQLATLEPLCVATLRPMIYSRSANHGLFQYGPGAKAVRAGVRRLVPLVAPY